MKLTILVLFLFGIRVISSIDETKDTSVLQYTITLSQFYTNSVVYIASDTTGLDTTQGCVLTDIISNQILKCKNAGFSCPCTGGEIIDLTPFTNYVVVVSNGGRALGEFHFRTASKGQIALTIGLNEINYNINYQNDEVVASLCSVVVINVESNEKIVSESASECRTGSVINLQKNTLYQLLILNNGFVLHDVSVNTGDFNLKVTSIGMEAFTYKVDSSVDISSSNCDLIDLISGTSFWCKGAPCNCKNDNVTSLLPDTNYNFQINLNGETLSEFSVLTASNGTITAIPYYNGLNFSVSYVEEDDTPTHCYPCNWDLINGIPTLDQCRNLISGKEFKEVHCKNFWFSTLTQNHSYITILMDSFGSVVGTKDESYVPLSEIYHTSYQLKSINYRLNTGLPFDQNKPCYILNSDQGSKRKCETNGVVSNDCPCLEGKMVDLPIDAYIYTRLMQDNLLLALDSRMYTADDGYTSLNSVGLYHIEYYVKYYHNSHPPYNCKACLLDYTIGNDNCPNDASIFGRAICRTYLFDSLNNGTRYRLRIFDGDGVSHTHTDYYTSDFPTLVTYKLNEKFVEYSLTFFSSIYTPIDCRFYFEEDPSQEAICEDFSCNCQKGRIIIPSGSKFKKLIVTDSENAVIANLFESGTGQGDEVTPAQLTAGPIIGICIFVLLIIIIIALTVAIIYLRKIRTYPTMAMAFQENL